MISPGCRMVFALFRISMDFIEHIRVSEERAQAGLGAEIDRPATIFGARIVGRVGVAENPSAEGDEATAFRLLTKIE